MARPAPAIDRAILVLTYLAEHPGEGFTLSEIARLLGLNKATCHAMFSSLQHHGLLTKHPVKKTYTLGPALIRIAHGVAPEEQQAVDYAREELTILADELGVTVIVTARFGEEVVIMARRLAPRYIPPTGRVPTVGARSRFGAPLAPIFAAWADPDEQEAWLKTLRKAPGEGETAHYRDMLRAIRERGFDLGLVSEPRSQLLRALSNIDQSADPDIEQLIAEIVGHSSDASTAAQSLDPSQKYLVHNITAPVFGTGGNVVIEVTLDGFGDPMWGREIEAHASRLLESTTRVSKAIHGRSPGRT